MFRRIGFMIIGAFAIHQAQSIFWGGSSLSRILTHFIISPFDFLTVSLLFLIGFLMFSSFFSYFLRLVFLVSKKKTQISGKDIMEFVVFATVVFALIHYGFWLPAVTCVFAFAYGWLSSDFRIEKEIRRFDRG